MRIIHISLFVSISSFNVLFAQNISSEDTLSYGINSKNLLFAYGQAYNLKIDKTFSRLVKNGFNHFFYLGYTNFSKPKIISTELNFMTGTLKSRGSERNLFNNYAGNIKLEYLKNISKVSNSKLSLYIGGSINMRGEVWFPQNLLAYGWDIDFGTAMNAVLQCKISPKLIFQYNMSVSLFGILWRSPNNGQQLTTEEIQLEKGIIAAAFEKTRFSHPFNTLYIDNSFRLFSNFSSKLNFYYHLIVSYKKINQPLIKKGYEFNNTIGLMYRL